MYEHVRVCHRLISLFLTRAPSMPNRHEFKRHGGSSTDSKLAPTLGVSDTNTSV